MYSSRTRSLILLKSNNSYCIRLLGEFFRQTIIDLLEGVQKTWKQRTGYLKNTNKARSTKRGM